MRANDALPTALEANAPGRQQHDGLNHDFQDVTAARVRAVRRSGERLLLPLSGALVLLLFTGSVRDAVLGLVAFAFAALALPAPQRWANLLPLMRSPIHATKPLIGIAVISTMSWATGAPDLTGLELAGVGLAVTLVAMTPQILMPHSWAPDRSIRVVVVGSVRVADELQAELRMEEIPEYTVVGRIAHLPNELPERHSVPKLGDIAHLSEIVKEHDIRLILFSADAPRFQLFSQVADTLLDLPVRLWELSGFYEDVFGHVPVAEINASWFQYIMHPRYRAVAPRSKRAMDLAVTLVVLPLLLPIIAIAALLIKRDGGPVLFKQIRIGEGGEQLVIYKLRTMQVESDSSVPQWASANDPRITGVGRFLRSTHIDEVPQLLNVLKGDMSLVGPRPEQPEFVARLEEFIPFYERRHLLKPGLTGWAQLRCGYAGSDTGSAWKLSHDLYYLKHRSLSFDLAILGETFRVFFGDRPRRIEPSRLTIVQRQPAEPVHSVSGQ